MSDSLRPHGLQPTRLLHPWDFPGKNTGVGCHCLLQPLSTKIVQIVGLSDELQKVHISEAILFFRPLEKHTPFSPQFLHPYLFIWPRLLREVCQNFSLPQGGNILQLDSSHQSSQSGRLNDPLTYFICSVFDDTTADSRNTDHLFLLDQIPPSLWAKNLQLILIKFTVHVPSISKSVQFTAVAQSCPTLCDPMNCSTPGLPVHHQLPEFTQTHVH